MNSRERINKALHHEEPDRVPIQDILWRSTIERWKREGLPNLSTEPDVEDYLGFEMTKFFPDLGPQFPREVLEKNEEYVIERNSFGEIVKNRLDYSTTPQIIESPVKSREDWKQFKKRLEPNKSRAISWRAIPEENEVSGWEDELQRFHTAYGKGKFILYCAIIGYDCIQRYVGSERLLMAIVTQPEWVKEMYMTQAELVIAMFELMEEEGFKFDGVFLASDLGYKNGLLFSLRHYEEQLFPPDKMICDYFNKKDIPVILHSDGYVKPLIPYFIKAGFSCLQPLEVKAGMDVRELKKDYGKELAFMGGIDVNAMAHPDPKVIEEEIKTKFEVAKDSGGYIYHSDHSVPDNVNFQQYKRVLELVHKYGQY